MDSDNRREQGGGSSGQGQQGHGGHGGRGRHRMNRHWQGAAEKAKQIAPAGATDMAEAGIQRMYDAIEEAGTKPEARATAALSVFAQNTLELSSMAAQAGMPAVAQTKLARALLKHTLDNFDEIEHSVLNGHRKD